jgi:hypothetical protein
MTYYVTRYHNKAGDTALYSRCQEEWQRDALLKAGKGIRDHVKLTKLTDTHQVSNVSAFITNFVTDYNEELSP